jgi:GAF domain-containing protein
MAQQNSTLKRTWELLTDPNPAISGDLERRRIRVLAGLSLGLLVIGVISVIVGLVFWKGPEQASGMTATVSNLGLWSIAYILSRTLYARQGAIVLVFGQAALTVYLLLSFKDPAVIERTGTFLLLPILFSTLLLPVLYTTTLALVSILTLVMLPVFLSWLPYAQVLTPMLVIFIISALAIGTAIVRERDLQIAQHQLVERSRHDFLEDEVQKRTSDIAVIAELGQAITSMRDLESLLSRAVNSIVDRFDFYFAQVFLIDASGKQAVMRAGTGTAGQELFARNHKLTVGSQSAVGKAAEGGNPIIIEDTDTDPLHRRNELLPLTRSEIAIPLRASGRTLGVLNIQSAKPKSFDSSSLFIFETMATQIAVAIENASLFEQAQRDLQDIETLNRQLTGEAWRRYLTGRSPTMPIGYESSSEGIRPLSVSDLVDEKVGDGVVSLPLNVRGETIGTLDMTSRSGHLPDDEMRTMLEAVAERVAQALDSTRLGEQAQRQAEREQILSRI